MFFELGKDGKWFFTHASVGADAHIGPLHMVRIRRNVTVIGTSYPGAMWASPPTGLCEIVIAKFLFNNFIKPPPERLFRGR